MGYRVEVTTLVEATCDGCGRGKKLVVFDHSYWRESRQQLRAAGWRARPGNMEGSVLCPDCKDS